VWSAARSWVIVWSFAAGAALITGSAAAQPVQTQAQALTDDAIQYAAAFAVSPDEALRRLKAQQASVAATDAIAREFAGRLAGISIDHSPEYRIVVLLTGNEPVPDRTAAGVPIVFRTGAKATHAQAVDAMRKHLIDLRSDLPNARGAGYDQRSGEVVLLVTRADADKFGIEAIRSRATQVSGVRVRVIINELNESNLSVDGGGRVEGLNLATNRRNLCTTAFVVTNGEANAIATAAHCPDELTYVDRDGTTVTLPMIGSWGAAYRDVQINGSPDSPEPLFYSNRGAGTLRRLVSWRNLASTRAGDFVCHYGESSGYSCATVELTDYAPPGELCGGPCSPTWVTVKGPNCIAGDSGGPVFSGEIAFGIAKGVNRADTGQCLFYYYMSTDFLPPPWLLLVEESVRRPPGRP
jgi:streptogrisin C